MNSNSDCLRPLWSVPLSEVILKKLKYAGYVYVEDVLAASDNELEVLLPRCEIKSLLRRLIKPAEFQTALSYLKCEDGVGRIITWSKALDKLLGDGVQLGRITELVSGPGGGATQICLQLCVSVRMPECVDGLQGQAFFIDTCAAFSPSRISDIYEACVKHCSLLCSSAGSSEAESFDKFASGGPLADIFCYVGQNFTQLRALIFYAEQLIKNGNRIKLIIIDSLVFAMRGMIGIERTAKVALLLEQLRNLANERNLAVVITNKLTTEFATGIKQVVPCLGESFAHGVHTRLILNARNGVNFQYHTAYLTKPYEKASVQFRIVDDGIRDVLID